MSAQAKNHIVYMPTMNYSYTAVKRSTGTSRPSGLGAALAKAVNFIAAIPQRQAVKTELSRLSDRELADIGLSRSEISNVFDRAR